MTFMIDSIPRGAIFSAPPGTLVKSSSHPKVDARHDPLVGAILEVVHRLQLESGRFSEAAGIVAVTEAGCTSHVTRVVSSVTDGLRPRQAFFARASATMLATYPALALSSHGPTFALSGRAGAVRWGLALAGWVVRSRQCDEAILLAGDALEVPPRLQAAAIRVGVDTPDHAGPWGDGTHLDDCLPSAVLAAWMGKDFALTAQVAGEVM